MTAVSAEESSLSSRRSWNLKAEMSFIFLNACGAEIALGPTNARAYMGIGWPINATNRPFSDPDTRMRKSTWSNDRRLCNILTLIRLAMAHALDAYRRNSANENEKTKTANMLKGCGRAVPPGLLCPPKDPENDPLAAWIRVYIHG
jgi:hypothetical protein